MTGMNVVGDCLEAEKCFASSRARVMKKAVAYLPFIDSRKPATRGMEKSYATVKGMSMILGKTL
jgi:cobalamin-dependent methionine synthase I